MLDPDKKSFPCERKPINHFFKFGQAMCSGEMIIENAGGIQCPVNISSASLHNGCGKIAGTVVIFEDLGLCKRREKIFGENEKQLAFLLELNDMLRPLYDPVEIQSVITRLTMEYFDADRCYYCENKDTCITIARDAKRSGLSSVAGTYSLGYFIIHRDLVDVGRSFSVHDVRTEKLIDDDLKRLFIQSEIISYLGVPVIKNGLAVGVLCIANSIPRNWTSPEANLAAEIAERTWATLERVNNEEALKRNEKDLAEAQHMGHMGNWTWNAKTGMQTWSKGLYKIYGIEQGSLTPSFDSFMKLVHPDDFEFMKRKFEDAVVDGDTPDFEFRIILDNGLVRVIRSRSKIAEFDDKGNPSIIKGISQDITDLKQIEETLRKRESLARELIEELKEADDNKNQFLNMLAHELRNPLAAISAGLQVLDITSEPRGVLKVKKLMKRQIDQLCRLIDDLLDLTRISNNRIELKKETIELNEFVRLVAGDYRMLYDKKGIKLHTKFGLEPIYIDADPVRLKQIIDNLLHNAQKYSCENGESVLSIYAEKEEAVISVKDNGIGLSPETMRYLFRPFVQVDMSLDRKGGGLGLGFSIVKAIAELHGGTVSANSEGLGKGSEFIIRLPLLDVKGRNRLGNEMQIDVVPRPLKILCIEDNRDFADLMNIMLTNMGHQVETSYDGCEGLEKVRQFKPDVVFCDIGLPGKNGYEIATAIKGDGKLKHIYLIALTGYAGENDLQRVRESGFDRHLVKPVDSSLLHKVINEYLNEKGKLAH